MLFLTTLIGVAVFGALAARFGAESRPGFDQRPDGDRFGALR
jgi:hypothetical protein